VILSFIPIITAGLVRVLIPDRTFELLEAAGLLVGLLGVVLIIRPTPESFATGDIGRLLILVAAVSNALGAVLVQRIDPPAPTPVLLAWAIPSGGIALHGVSAFVVRESYTNISLALPGLLAVGYLALFVNIMGYLIFFGFLRRVGAFEVSLINYFQPIATAVIGWLILSEQLALSTIGGFCLILFGFLLIKRDSVRQYVVRQDVPF
jgi:drug/metabolite transporter (DMT)-like permease